MPAKIEFDNDIVGRICDHLSSGGSIASICGSEGIPSEPTIYREMGRNEEFRKKIDVARANQQEYEADQCVKMADEATAEDWQVVKLRIWARQWRAAKLAPKKYGDKQSIEHSNDPENPIDDPLRVAKEVAFILARGNKELDDG